MELIDRILLDENIDAAIRAVKGNKGAPGMDKMPVEALDEYFRNHREEIKAQMREKKYKPQPVRRVYIPKANGKQRPLGIPTVVDRVIQQATAQVLSRGYERYFSEYSYGFRPNRDCHMAIRKVLWYLNSGYEWVIDLDIEKYFDTVNHDKLISIRSCHREKCARLQYAHPDLDGRLQHSTIFAILARFCCLKTTSRKNCDLW